MCHKTKITNTTFFKILEKQLQNGTVITGLSLHYPLKPQNKRGSGILNYRKAKLGLSWFGQN